MTSASDDRRAAFAGKMTAVLNASAVNTALCLGYRTGLLEAMDRLGGAATSDGIAREAGLDGRYVREWLCVMVCGGIVDLAVSPSGEDLFTLPREHADLLTRRAGSGNIGVYTQELPILTRCVLDDVQRAFRTGEGVPYDRYPPFHDWMAQVAEAKHRKMLVDVFLPSVAGGAVVARLKRGIRVLDVGCSEGVAVLLMAAAFPESSFTGIDISEEALAVARAEAGRLGISNTRFELRDAAGLKDDPVLAGSFDYVTAFDAVHDQTRPLDVLKGIRAVLADGGLFSMVDIKAETELSGNVDHPLGAFLYTVSLMHCMPVGLVDGGAGLGTMWGRGRALEMLREAGFATVEVCEIPTDPFNAHYLCGG
ncbi:class I SAM-dependent methyltransferase [Fundidesulfovibrio terrae]|uniref:class I SAM-dependent methyltransferase n=1 Tax=Fundidesulfovibrio terrae TaxID=2922866 RepID=UPI001FB02AF2|nr:class I SAM-dependent methyltransferase [Fundidesulfovibrio terrae]